MPPTLVNQKFLSQHDKVISFYHNSETPCICKTTGLTPIVWEHKYISWKLNKMEKFHETFSISSWAVVLKRPVSLIYPFLYYIMSDWSNGMQLFSEESQVFVNSICILFFEGELDLFSLNINTYLSASASMLRIFTARPK